MARFSSCPRAAGEWLIHTLPQAQATTCPCWFHICPACVVPSQRSDAAAAKMYETGKRQEGCPPGPLRWEDSWSGAARTWQALFY